MTLPADAPTAARQNEEMFHEATAHVTMEPAYTGPSPKEGYADTMHIRPTRQESPEFHVALRSVPGMRERNEDYVGFVAGTPEDRIAKGSVLAMADGMSGAAGGRVAAELTVRGFLEAYYGLPATLRPELAAGRALDTINRWLFRIGRTDASLREMAASFAALIIRAREAYIVSAGDVRVYHIHDGACQQINTDDFYPTTMGGIITNAPGLRESVTTEMRRVAIEKGDLFVLCTDGFYRGLSRSALREALFLSQTAPLPAQDLIDHAKERGSTDDITVAVMRILDVPPLDGPLIERVVAALPLMPPPSLGATVDGYRLERIAHDGHYSRLIVAEDTHEPPTTVLIKFPKPSVRRDENVRRGFMKEAWINSRVRHPQLVLSRPLGEPRQTQLYLVMPYFEGETLETMLQRSPLPWQRAKALLVSVAKAVYALNRVHIFHRDIKPANILLLRDGGLKLLDLGLAHTPGLPGDAPLGTPGTPGYMAPELLAGGLGDARSEVFALGVTLYRALSGGRMPYGLRGLVPLTHFRRDIPYELSLLIEKALSPGPDDRHQDALEFAFDLEQIPAQSAMRRHPRTPLLTRNPLAFWRWSSALLLILLLALLAWRLP